MVPAWSLLLALLAGAAAGWFARAYLWRRPSPAPAPPVAPPATTEDPGAAEPALKMEAVLTELERRYQGRKAEPDPAPRPKRTRTKKA